MNSSELQKVVPQNNHIHLTEREKEVLKLICQQLTAREIAKRLNIAVPTVGVYRYNLFKKVKPKNIIGLAFYAVKQGIYVID
jgi:DNA-binding CsgD family transcriptional regulator